MTTSTITLSEFLLARVAEDKAVALAAAASSWRGGPPEPHWNVLFVHQEGISVWGSKEPEQPEPLGEHEGTDEMTTHIARHDPARALAECEAKRRIVDEHPYRLSEADRHLCEDRLIDDEACNVFRILASVYADHPDYRDEWKV